MKRWNKPIRMSSLKEVKRKRKLWKNRFAEYGVYERCWGVTNWMVGTCNSPLNPWIQVDIGYFYIQIKWYLIVLFLMVVSFILGKLL